MTEITLDKVYAEVKRMRTELKSIEKLLVSLKKESLMPEEKISPKK